METSHLVQTLHVDSPTFSANPVQKLVEKTSRIHTNLQKSKQVTTTQKKPSIRPRRDITLRVCDSDFLVSNTLLGSFMFLVSSGVVLLSSCICKCLGLTRSLVLFTTYTCSVDREGQEEELTATSMAEMKISDTHFLKSATQEEITTTNCHLLREGFRSLAMIRSHYFKAFAHMEGRVAQSRFERLLCFVSHCHSVTHMHAYIYIYMYVCVCVCDPFSGMGSEVDFITFEILAQ